MVIRDAIAFLLLLAGWFAVWLATPGHAAEAAPVHASPAGDWLLAAFFAAVIAAGIWTLCGRARVQGDES